MRHWEEEGLKGAGTCVTDYGVLQWPGTTPSASLAAHANYTSHQKQALDLFAQFFISPLMRPEASARELQAIESEFNLSRGNDSTRCMQLVCPSMRPSIRSLLCACIGRGRDVADCHV